MVGAGLVSAKLQKLNGQLKTGTATSEKEIPSKSFVDFLKKYGNEHQPCMIYDDGQDFRAWQQAFRRKLESLRGPIPKRVNCEIDILETTELPDHNFYFLSITSFSAYSASC
jgi:hypothetical protein